MYAKESYKKKDIEVEGYMLYSYTGLLIIKCFFFTKKVLILK